MPANDLTSNIAAKVVQRRFRGNQARQQVIRFSPFAILDGLPPCLSGVALALRRQL